MKIKFYSRRCIGCRACEVACKLEHNLPAGVRWRSVVSRVTGQYPNLAKEYFSRACLHCATPECAKVCPVEAIRKAAGAGIVLLEEEGCIGCKACVKACPHGTMSFNDQKSKAGKCTLCKHRLTEEREPACVAVCLALALKLLAE